jgi:hypothetical protein
VTSDASTGWIHCGNQPFVAFWLHLKGDFSGGPSWVTGNAMAGIAGKKGVVTGPPFALSVEVTLDWHRVARHRAGIGTANSKHCGAGHARLMRKGPNPRRTRPLTKRDAQRSGTCRALGSSASERGPPTRQRPVRDPRRIAMPSVPTQELSS